MGILLDGIDVAMFVYIEIPYACCLFIKSINTRRDTEDVPWVASETTVK